MNIINCNNYNHTHTHTHVHTHTLTDYTLPPSPAMVADHPVSVHAAYGSTVVFNCSIKEQSSLVSGTLYTSLLAWRFNGSSLSFNEQGQVSSYPPHWSVNTQEGYSELVVANTSAADDGYYECVVGDGLHKLSEGVWRVATLTVSKRAWLNTHTGECHTHTHTLVTVAQWGFSHIPHWF